MLPSAVSVGQSSPDRAEILLWASDGSQGAQTDLLFPAHYVVVLGQTSCPSLKHSAKAAVTSGLGMEGLPFPWAWSWLSQTLSDEWYGMACLSVLPQAAPCVSLRL